MISKSICIRFKFKKQAGETFIEILFALVIFSVGTLGQLLIQNQSLMAKEKGFSQTYAIALIDDISEKIRSNKAGALASYYSNFDSTNFSSSDNCLLNTSCSPQQIANYDLENWKNKISPDITAKVFYTLPSAKAEIQFIESERRYEITLTWVDREFQNADSGTKSNKEKVIIQNVVI